MKPISFFYLCVLAFVLNGCSASYRQRRDIKKLDGLVLAQPVEFARLSNLLNPCFNGKSKSDTVITTHTDTLVKDGITTIIRVKDTVYVTKTIPIMTTRILNIHDTVTDGRALAYLNSQLKNKTDSLKIANHDNAKVSHEKTIWMWLSIGLMVLDLVLITIKVYTFFSGGGVVSAIKKVI